MSAIEVNSRDSALGDRQLTGRSCCRTAWVLGAVLVTSGGEASGGTYLSWRMGGVLFPISAVRATTAGSRVGCVSLEVALGE